MISRRRLLGAVGATLVGPLTAEPQQARRIAYISAVSMSPTFVKDLEDALRDLGWILRRNIVVEYRSAEGQYSRLPALVEDVLRPIRKATNTVPIVMVGHGDPIRLLPCGRARDQGAR